MALQIQHLEKDTFKNIFIHEGPFHIVMAECHAMGFIDECGLPCIMVQAGLLAGGPVSGFISGKHYNRCKRLYPLIYAVLEELHFDQFLKDNNITIGDSLHEFIGDFQKNKMSAEILQNVDLNNIYLHYSLYRNDTLNGEHGKTAKFYAILIELIQDYLIFSRSIRTGDFDTFKFIIHKIINLFFIFNQQNYSRWLTRYHDNLLNVHETHPELAEEFEKGMFGVRRTSNNFARIPIDLTLEQTINADAARRVTRVTHFNNSIAARQRWAKSSPLRTTIISHIYNVTGLKKHQDVSAELEKSRIKLSVEQMKALKNNIIENMNPFDHHALQADETFQY